MMPTVSTKELYDALYTAAKNSSLTSSTSIYTALDTSFPIYDVGKELKNILDSKGIDDLSTFAQKNQITSRYLTNLLANRQSLNRKTAIAFCFYLDLDYEEANDFLIRIRQHALHLRSYDELIYAFFLKNHLPFEEAEQLIQFYAKEYNKKANKSANYGGQAISALIAESYTSQIRADFDTWGENLDDLKNFLDNDGKEQMSELNASATLTFQKCIEEIRKDIQYSFAPQEQLRNELDTDDTMPCLKELYQMTLDTLGDHGKGTKGSTYTKAQKRVLQNNREDTLITDSSILCSIHTFKHTIPRKNFLLTLVLYNEVILLPDWENEWLDGSQEESKEYFLYHKSYEFINEELVRCGFPPLHPNVPFDYIILEAFLTENPAETIDQVNRLLLNSFEK